MGLQGSVIASGSESMLTGAGTERREACLALCLACGRGGGRRVSGTLGTALWARRRAPNGQHGTRRWDPLVPQPTAVPHPRPPVARHDGGRQLRAATVCLDTDLSPHRAPAATLSGTRTWDDGVFCAVLLSRHRATPRVSSHLSAASAAPPTALW